jgi:hypothetical protein
MITNIWICHSFGHRNLICVILGHLHNTESLHKSDKGTSNSPLSHFFQSPISKGSHPAEVGDNLTPHVEALPSLGNLSHRSGTVEGILWQRCNRATATAEAVSFTSRHQAHRPPALKLVRRDLQADLG